METVADDLPYWLALLRGPGVGPARFRRFLEHIDSPRVLFDPDRESPLHDTLPEPLRTYVTAPDWGQVERDLRWLQEVGASALTLRDARYPALLRQIAAPPPVLFVRGNVEALSRPQLAVVGSRHPTPSGRQTAHAFAAHLGAAGLAITSGLARGVDAAAHEGALAAGVATLAVAGTGLDRVYPACHRDLAERIAEHGALLSEFPPGTPPTAANFPRRNRVISGLCLGTLVVEAAPHSGSLITARLAAEQGREVFAIPGSIHNPLARGCHALLRQGAKLVETATDVLEELGPLYEFQQQEQGPNTAKWPLDEAHYVVYEALGFEPSSVDAVVARSGLTAEAVCSMLLVLELHGFAVSTVSGHYCRAAERT